MIEVLQFIFSDFWVFIGFHILILSFGWSASMPFYWINRLREGRTAISGRTNVAREATYSNN
jgi:hypothetical protein